MMLNGEHQESERFTETAEDAARAGKHDEARLYYSLAADAEANALAKISPEMPRTYNAVAMSVIALYYKAHRYRDAQRYGYELLASDKLNAEARREIRETIDLSIDEEEFAVIPAHPSGRRIDIALKGGTVGSGTADLGLVLEQLTGHFAIARRVAEWRLGVPLRVAGPPSPEIDGFVGARVTQAFPGSYKISIDFSAQQQSLLPDLPREKIADDIGRIAFDIIYATFRQELDDLKQLITDDDYLKTILRIIRNIVPDGRRVAAVELRQNEGQKARLVRFTQQQKPLVVAALRALEPPSSKEDFEYHGTLRLVDLEKRAIEVHSKGERRRFISRHNVVLDDFIGPMVNRFVVVRARRYQRTNEILDIELDELPSRSKYADEKTSDISR